MNKLVIIGNGFDLAHGLPTSYKDFIDDYWLGGNKIYTKDDSLVYLNIHESISLNQIKSFNDIKKVLDSLGYYKNGNLLYKNGSKKILEFKNQFFRVLNQELSIKNWVDIERIYYTILKGINKGKINPYKYSGDVGQLNKEFDQVKNLLEHYLSQRVKNTYEWDRVQKINESYTSIYNSLTPISIFNKEHNISKEFTKQEDRDSIEKTFESQKNGDHEKYRVSTCLLNFNYTPTLSTYFRDIRNEEFYDISIIYIHGELESQLNCVNFGFGDELDEEYKEIENLDDNEFLRFFKSFQYLQNDNYEKTLNYIDSEPFQVCIMGHSCGLSDRTLLNTIFEHKNCRSIKVFYYEYVEDGIKKDNYTEIVQNISRHFDDKKAMREKIVNKTLCKPLPQNVRFNKKTH